MWPGVAAPRHRLSARALNKSMPQVLKATTCRGCARPRQADKLIIIFPCGLFEYANRRTARRRPARDGESQLPTHARVRMYPNHSMLARATHCFRVRPVMRNKARARGNLHYCAHPRAPGPALLRAVPLRLQHLHVAGHRAACHQRGPGRSPSPSVPPSLLPARFTREWTA